MKVLIDGQVIAQSEKTVEIEGNPYFPPESLTEGILEKSDTDYHCPWKGDAQYFHAQINDKTHPDVAWSYPNLKEGAVEKVGEDFAGYLAFDQRKATVSS